MEERAKEETNVEEDDFSGLHSVISQNVELFITTGVRTQNPNYRHY
jgi:hypothetical protein